MKKCPFCGEEIKDSAKKCKHCGEWLENAYNKEPSLNIKKCLYCGKEVKSTAIKCKHCGAWLNKKQHFKSKEEINTVNNLNSVLNNTNIVIEIIKWFIIIGIILWVLNDIYRAWVIDDALEQLQRQILFW